MHVQRLSDNSKGMRDISSDSTIHAVMRLFDSGLGHSEFLEKLWNFACDSVNKPSRRVGRECVPANILSASLYIQHEPPYMSQQHIMWYSLRQCSGQKAGRLACARGW